MSNTETKSRPVRKAAIIIGFVALLVLIAWLSIMIVRNVPGSFASLASLAESVRSFDASRVDEGADTDETPSDNNLNNNGTLLVVTSDTNVIETDTTVRLSWTDASKQGSFVFAYECQAGVAVSIVDTEGLRNINCDTNYNLGNINTTTLTITSEKERFADVAYSIAFIEGSKDTPSAVANAFITVVNESIDLTFSENDTATEDSVIGTDSQETESTNDVTATPSTGTTDTGSTPPVEPTAPTEPTNPVYTQEFTYTIPVSNPNGRIDLATRFLSTGAIRGGSFVSGTLRNETAGAIQFEVKNLGTKTSEAWTYSIALPTGNTVTSSTQAPLKPNERAVITIGFPATETTSHDFVVTLDTTADYASVNNSFKETVSFN